MGAAKILLIEDDDGDAKTFQGILRGQPVEIVWCPTGAEGIQAYRKNTLGYATVVIDYLLPDLRGSDVAQQIRRINPEQDILFSSGYSNPDYLTDMLRTGMARTFIVKGGPIDDARDAVMTSIRLFENRGRVIGADNYSPDKAERDAAQFGFVGRSRAIHELIEQVKYLRSLPVDIRVNGDSGTGKQLVINALVPEGQRLVECPCPQLNSSENAFESELFGHVKGSFTGADFDKVGLLLQAHKNVLFLDEVHTLSRTNQDKFLHVLQERKFRRKGDDKALMIPVTFRLFSAAKPVIHQMVKTEEFKPDLYHRLGRADIYIPPLRERPEDIEPLVRHYQDFYNRTVLPQNLQKQFRISTIREMEKYPWSVGNVRELEAAICNMMLNARGDIINPSEFDQYLKALAARSGEVAPIRPTLPMPDAADKVIREQILAALKASRTQLEAANKLGVDRSKLIRAMKRLGINSNAYLIKPKKEEPDAT